MAMKLYVVFDTVAGEADSIPFPSKTDGIAIRNFRIHLTSKTPDTHNDYQLWSLGDYDPEKMQIRPNLVRIPMEDLPLEVVS